MNSPAQSLLQGANPLPLDAPPVRMPASDFHSIGEPNA